MIKHLVSLLTNAEPAAPEDRESAERVAIAALLVEAAHADGVYLESEKAMIDRVLAALEG